MHRREEEKKKAEKRGGDASQAGVSKQKEDGVKLSDLQVRCYVIPVSYTVMVG